MVGGGDQLYNDSLWSCPSLEAWTVSRWQGLNNVNAIYIYHMYMYVCIRGVCDWV